MGLHLQEGQASGVSLRDHGFLLRRERIEYLRVRSACLQAAHGPKERLQLRILQGAFPAFLMALDQMVIGPEHFGLEVTADGLHAELLALQWSGQLFVEAEAFHVERQLLTWLHQVAGGITALRRRRTHCAFRCLHPIDVLQQLGEGTG